MSSAISEGPRVTSSIHVFPTSPAPGPRPRSRRRPLALARRPSWPVGNGLACAIDVLGVQRSRLRVALRSYITIVDMSRRQDIGYRRRSPN